MCAIASVHRANDSRPKLTGPRNSAHGSPRHVAGLRRVDDLAASLVATQFDFPEPRSAFCDTSARTLRQRQHEPSSDSAALQTPIRWHFELTTISVAMFKIGSGVDVHMAIAIKMFNHGHLCFGPHTRRINPSPPRGIATLINSGRRRKWPTASRSVVFTSCTASGGIADSHAAA